MEQLLACALREVADGALGDSILEVGIDATEGELLSRVVVGLLERVAARVFADELLIWRWTKLRRLQWSTKIVAHL